MDIVSNKEGSPALPPPGRKRTLKFKYERGVGADQVAFSLPISLLAFFSVIKYLAFSTTIIFMTIYRVTYPRAFFIYLTGNLFYDDLIIVILGCLTCLTIFRKNRRLLFYSLSLTVGPLLISMGIDNLISLDIASMLVFPGILISYYLFRKKVDLGKRITKNSIVMTGAGVLFVIELLSLITWIIYPSYAKYWHEIFSPSSEWYLAGVEAQLFYAAARLAPAIALILSFSFLVRPGFTSIMQLFTGKDARIDEEHHLLSSAVAGDEDSTSLIKNNAEAETDDIEASSPKNKPPSGMETNRSNIAPIFRRKASSSSSSRERFWLFVSVSLIVLFSLYPYIASINKDFSTVSVDSGYYVNQINNIKNNGVFSKDGPFSFSSERALSVLLFYGIAAAMPSVPTNVVVAYLPIFLGSFLVLSAYLLIRYGPNPKENLRTSHFIAPLLVPFSIQFIVGIYGGYFSNMLAISFMLLTLLFYLRFLRSSKMLDLGLFVAMMFMTLFSHVYTWVFLVATLVISTAVLAIVKRKTEKKKPHVLLISSIAITVAVLLALSSTLTGKSGIDYINGIINTNTGQNFLETRWFNINNTFRFYLGGFLANTVLMGLALVWAFKADYKNHFNAVILASIFIFSAFFFLGDEVTQSRIFFNIPLFIPAAIVLSNFTTGKYFPSLDSRTRSLIVVVIFLYLGNYSLRSLANFYLIVPPTPT